ncbi:nicotinate phosphoribosyltransferase [bacterium]|nr:nicotinate phosphoribosyltransferase [bacterium]
MLKRWNETLNTDLYEIRMAAGYALSGMGSRVAVFELFYRQNPFKGGFCISAGLEQAVEYIENIRLYGSDIDFFRKHCNMSPEMTRLFKKDFHFDGDIYAIPEGTVVFPDIPILKVKAKLPVAQLIETALLSIIGHQTLIATKAARLCLAAEDKPIIEFGSRRAHGVEAAYYGARAAFIGGCIGTSNVKASKDFHIPAIGTHSHSWVESFPSELEAFREFARLFPDIAVLLVDTYDTINIGLPNAIIVAKELEARNHRLLGIRLDSGDLALLSKKARQMLDQSGLDYVRIVASNDLDESIIENLRLQGAHIDLYGVGTKLITAYPEPALGQVYKLTAVEDGNGVLLPKIKLSSNVEKITNPGDKKVIRYSDETGAFKADVLFLDDEPLPSSRFLAYDQMFRYLHQEIDPGRTSSEGLLVPVYKKGKLVYKFDSLTVIQKRTKSQLERLKDEYKRLLNPDIYRVYLSEKLFDLKQRLITEYSPELL